MYPHPMLAQVSCLLLSAALLCGCREVRESSGGLDVKAAQVLADVRLPTPASAVNVQVKLITETQNSDLFVYFEAPLADIRDVIGREMGTSNGSFEERPLAPRPEFPLDVSSPNWWKPEGIKNGFYVGKPGETDSPLFWVDRDKQCVFFYQHYQ